MAHSLYKKLCRVKNICVYLKVNFLCVIKEQYKKLQINIKKYHKDII